MGENPAVQSVRGRCSTHDVTLIEHYIERGPFMVPTGEFYCIHCARELLIDTDDE